MNKVFIILILLLSVTANAQWTKAFHLLEIPKDSCLALPEHVGLYNIQYSDDIYLYISNGDSYQLSPDGEVYGKRRINWYTTEHYPIDPRFTILQIKNGPTEFIAKLDSDG